MATVLITGANRGLGLEFTRQLSGRGDDVLALCRLPERAGDRPVDILINNAGIIGPDRQSPLDMDFDGWAHTLAVNTIAPLRVIHTFIGNLRAAQGARIMTLSSYMRLFQLGRQS